MLIPTRRLSRAAFALVASGIIVAWPSITESQWMFDPYMPYNSDYVGFVAPIIPNNLALPNSARIASEYSSGAPVSRFNTFDRWLNDYESDIARGRREPGRGMGREVVDRGDMSRYIPNRLADSRFEREEDQRTRGFFSEESQRARIAVERDRYYAAASRVSDPTRRAAYMKVVARLSNPKTAPEMLREIDEANAESVRPTTTTPRRAPAAVETAPDRPRSVLSNPPRTRPRPPTRPTETAGSTNRPAATTSLPTPTPAPPPVAPSSATEPKPTVRVPDDRPPAPSSSRARPSAPAPLPASGDVPLPAPEPLPDDLPPPPR